MRLGLALILLSTFVLAVATRGNATLPTTLYIYNMSTTVSDAELANDLPAFQAAVNDELAPYWHVQENLVIGDAPPGAPVIDIEDDSPNVGMLGFHSLSNGNSYGIVYAQTAESYGESWSITLTHELFELLVDPYVSRFKVSHQKNWLVEVSDPVEALSYPRPGADGTPVRISDFITPAWYTGSGPRINGHGKYDLMGKTRKANQILFAGYAYVYDGGIWIEVNQDGPLSPDPFH